jgi:outer membrane lipoprotein-sorting protein
MTVMASRPLLRWLLPAGVAAVVLAGGVTAAAVRAAADLPRRDPAQLLVDLQTARLDGGSGTVVQKADLGLPDLPVRLGGGGSPQFSSLVAGAHTLRVWYSGPDKARIALLGALGESDLVRNGPDVWVWSSLDNTAQHRTLPQGTEPGHGASASPDPTALPMTPQQAADQALALLDPTTVVTAGPAVRVAGRDAYELILSPRDTGTLVASIRVAIDGVQHVPLRVQVYARGYASPAFEVGFTDVSFTRPDDEQFAFTPPPGAKITEGGAATKPPAASERPGNKPPVATIGSGWTTVVAARPPSITNQTFASIRASLPRATGPWGSGRLLTSRLFTVLLTDDGRVLVGAVDTQRLLAAAADPAAAVKATR